MFRSNDINDGIRQLFLFTPLQYMLDALAERPVMATIIVDAEHSPQTAMILWGHYLFVGGRATEEAGQFLTSDLLPTTVRNTLHGLIVFYPATETQPNWQNLIMTLFDNRCQTAERSVFNLVPQVMQPVGPQTDDQQNGTPSIGESLTLVRPTDASIRPTDASIRPIDASLMQSSVTNLDMITDEILGTATYADMDDFMERGIGFCLVVDNRVCGFCTSEYPSGSSVAIDRKSTRLNSSH